MLKDFVKAVRPDDGELSKRLSEERSKLFASQMKIKEAGLPVMVTFEGWGAAGKGSVLGKIIKNIDPRFFKVKTYPAPTKEDKAPKKRMRKQPAPAYPAEDVKISENII